MRLRYAALPRPQIPAIPLAAIALLVLTIVMIAGMYAAPRGPALRFASMDLDGGFDESNAVRVEVLSEPGTVVDGEPVPPAGLAAAVASRLAGRPDPAVVLIVSPEATYESMVAAYGAIAALPGPPRIGLPKPQHGLIQ
jgi:biopolymer transport protein ExbD